MSIKKRAPAHHSSLNTKQDCLKIVDTFRGSTPFEATFTFTVITARQLVVPPRETLSIGFRILISLHPAIQTTGRLTFAPAGLPPAEHTSLSWTHFRTAGFPQYGWKVGISGGAFPSLERFKRWSVYTPAILVCLQPRLLSSRGVTPVLSSRPPYGQVSRQVS
jgi:hypothetical protein